MNEKCKHKDMIKLFKIFEKYKNIFDNIKLLKNLFHRFHVGVIFENNFYKLYLYKKYNDLNKNDELGKIKIDDNITLYLLLGFNYYPIKKYEHLNGGTSKEMYDILIDCHNNPEKYEYLKKR